jgi:competence ComEA-like helix-hairpin-helix protein
MRFLREKFFHLLPEPTARTFRSALAIAAIAVVLALVMAWRALPKSDLQGAPIVAGEVKGEALGEVVGEVEGEVVNEAGTEFFDEGTSDIAISDIEISQPGTIFIHVIGQVAKPGVVEIPFGSRVVLALEKAGGLLSGQKIEDVNLARVLTDGEQIYFGPKRNAPPKLETPRASRPALPPNAGRPSIPNSSRASAAPTSASTSNLINLNSATSTDLELLPGVGPVLAKRIIDFRKTHGGFLSVEGLLEVKGIGAKTFKEISQYVTV